MDSIALLLGGLTYEEEANLIKSLCYLLFLSFLGFLIFTVCIHQAPYGRYARQPKWIWGCPLNARVGWFVQEFPSLVIPLLCLALVMTPRDESNTDGDGYGKAVNWILLSCFIAHYVHRALIYPFLIRGNSPTTCLSVAVALLLCIVDGYVHGRYLTKFASYNKEWISDPRFICGIILFITGMAINIYSDNTLRNLRKPGETGYKIPKGGLFEYISGANFFGEAVEWIGYGLASWSLVGLTMPILTLSNTVPRAVHHHR